MMERTSSQEVPVRSYVMNISRENFQNEVMKADRPVLLDFWAPWCGPCRMIAPVVEAVAASHDELTVGKVNVDEEVALAARFQVASIPTLVVLQGGKVVASTIGYCPKEEIEQLLSR